MLAIVGLPHVPGGRLVAASRRDRLIAVITRLDRQQIIAQLRRCPSRFPIDLTDEWLGRQSLDELRHVFAAICLQCNYIPHVPRRTHAHA